MTDNALEIRKLSKRYKDFLLDDISFALPNGCILGLIGENGAGKSTTIKLILDMLKRDGGEIEILGHNNKENLRLTKEDLGVVLDDVGIPDGFKVNTVNRVMKNIFKNWDEATFYGYVRSLGIPESKRFKELSLGNRKKLGLSIALSHSPKLIILDEATSGLDPVIRDEIITILSDFTRDEEHSVLISSHIVSDLEKICDYITFLHKGKLMLFEEKDVLKDEYCLLQCTREQFNALPKEISIGMKESPFGVEAIVRRSGLKEGGAYNTAPIDIEQLFVFMAKEA